MEDSYSVENVMRLCVFMFQTCFNSLLCTDSQYSSQKLAIGASFKDKNTKPLYIFNWENPQNSESQKGPRRELDYIALVICTSILKSGWSMKKLFCCPALEIFHCLPLCKTVLFVSSRPFSLYTLIFFLSTPADNSEATWKKATKCIKKKNWNRYKQHFVEWENEFEYHICPSTFPIGLKIEGTLFFAFFEDGIDTKSKLRRRFHQIFMAFSEYLNFRRGF